MILLILVEVAMRFSTSQNSFRSGRLSEKLHQRFDSAQYREGMSEMVGMKPLPEGGMERVKGSRHIHVRNYETVPIKSMKHFHFVLKDVPWIMTIRTLENNKTTIGFNRTNYYYVPFSDEGHETIIKAGATYYDASLFDMTMDGEKIFITHFSGDFVPLAVWRDDSGQWLIRALTTNVSMLRNRNDTTGSLAVSGTYHAGAFTFPMEDLEQRTFTISNFNSTNMTIDLTSTNATIATWLQGADIIYAEGLGSKDFGDGATRAVAMSTFYRVQEQITNGVRVSVDLTYSGSDAMVYFSVSVKLSSRNIWSRFNQPKTVTNHEGRLVFGGCPSHPLNIFGSKVGRNNFFCQLRFVDPLSEFVSVPPPFGDVEVTDPYIYKMSSRGDNFITNIQSIGHLCVFTDVKEHIATGNDTILSALSVNIKPQSSQGSSPIASTTDGMAVYYLSKQGKTIYRFKYNGKNGSMLSTEIGLLLSDVFEEDTALDIEWVPYLNSLLVLMKSGKVWALQVSSDGEFIAPWDTNLSGVKALCYVTGLYMGDYARQYLGAHVAYSTFDEVNEIDTMYAFDPQFVEDGKSFPVVGDITENEAMYHECVVRQFRQNSEEGELNDVIFNGQLFNQFDPDPTPYVLPALVYHEGEELIIIDIDTKEKYPYTVTGGGFVHDSLTYRFINDPVINALPKILICKKHKTVSWATLPVEAGQQWGSAQLGIKNIDTLSFRAYKTYSLEFSSDKEKWDEANFTDEDGFNTGRRVEKKFSSNPKYDMIIYMRNNKAEPVTLTGLSMRGVSNDG